MNWMLASIAASVVAASAPLLMVESVPAVRKAPDLVRSRRRLWGVTFLSLLTIAIWLYVDRAAVAAGHRSLAVTSAAVGLFFVLFVVFAYPALRIVQRSGAARPHPASARIPVFRAPLDVPVLLLVLAAAPAVALSPNDIGYRLKGAGTVAAGVALYFMGRPRAPRTFFAFVTSAAITLFAQWQNPWQRTIGVIGQLTVAVIGFVWCARLLAQPTPSDSASGDDA